MTDEETPDLAFWLAREGAIVLVPPTGADRSRVFLTADEFLKEAPTAVALAIAGVGKLRTRGAAFARGRRGRFRLRYCRCSHRSTRMLLLVRCAQCVRHAFEPLDAMTKMFSRSEHVSKSSAWTRISKDTETVFSLRHRLFRNLLCILRHKR